MLSLISSSAKRGRENSCWFLPLFFIQPSSGLRAPAAPQKTFPLALSPKFIQTFALSNSMEST